MIKGYLEAGVRENNKRFKILLENFIIFSTGYLMNIAAAADRYR